jgi:hypothetical protein
MSSKRFVFDMALASLRFPAFTPAALCLWHGVSSLDMVSFQALYVFTMALASLRLPAFTPSVHAFGMVLSNLHMAALTPSALCLWHGAFHIVHGLTLLMRACHWMHATCQQPRQITHIQLSCLS